MRRIPEEVITQVIKEYEEGSETPTNLARKYNLSWSDCGLTIRRMPPADAIGTLHCMTNWRRFPV